MKFNNRELADLSDGEATIEGRLHHKKLNGGYSHSAFKEKWFKLRANILFYFHLSETGQKFDKKPVGAYVLENMIVQYEMNSEAPFSFSFSFNDEPDKKHLFSGRSQENVNKWVDALKQASYEYWRSQLILLQEKLRSITGQDPLLMYPRNKGCRNVFEDSAMQTLPKTSSKVIVESSKSQFYTVDKEKKESNTKKDEIPKNSTISFDNIFDNVLVIKSESGTPPVRPARGNKTKSEVECANLIDL